MRKIIRFAFGTVFFIFIIGAAVAAAQNYNVLILTPPAGFNETAGDGIRGSQRVGAARISDAPYPEQTHAFLWKGNLAIDLNPSGYMYSRAYDTDGVHQVGWGNFSLSSRPYRALLWYGTRESVVDLSPANFTLSFARGVRNGYQVGYGQNYDDQGSLTTPHALVWHGTAASAVDLGAGGVINDTNGFQHVGEGDGGYYLHAFVWTGTQLGGLDLHQYLPQGVYVASGA